MSRRILTFAAAAVLALASATSVLAANGAVKMTEQNDRYAFTPHTAYVNVGGSVTWKNGTDAAHTVTSDSGSELASSTIGAGKSFSHTFSAVGTFGYHCTIHTYMTGKIVVLAADATAPATDVLPSSAPAAPDGTPVGVIAFLVIAGAWDSWPPGDASRG